MTIHDAIVLPPDVEVIPIEQLPAQLRRQFGYRAGDFAVTRPLAREPSSIVDRATACLLETFREPATLASAVIRFSAAEHLDPRQTLKDAFPVLTGFLNAGLLVRASSRLAMPITTSRTAGDHIAWFEVIHPVHIIADTEVYLARTQAGEPGAVKITRNPADQRIQAMFAHEAAILANLDGQINPRLLLAGADAGQAFLALSWCDGVDVVTTAEELRRLDRSRHPDELLQLASRVLEAYAHLHEQGVMHGDVHPRNVLADAQGRVTLIDYGLAQLTGGTPADPGVPRGGVAFFMEPELAAARLAGNPAPPPLTPAGEQYSIAALVYLLLTGAHTHAFSLEEKTMLRQLTSAPPLPFAAHRAPRLPEVERRLRQALAKNPHDRFGSVSEFRHAFRDAVARDHTAASTPTAAGRRRQPGQALLEDVITRLAIDGPLLRNGLPAPTAPVMNGASGLAYTLLRMAVLRGDEHLLASADLWQTKALNAAGPEAFRNPQLQIASDNREGQSLYHTAAGVHCVQALLAHARADIPAQQSAIAGFVAAAQQPCPQIDIISGRAGLLLGCALLAETITTPAQPETNPLCILGDDLAHSIGREQADQPSIAKSEELTFAGVAHGWAGLLYSILRWGQARGTPPSAILSDRLAELAALGIPARRGHIWPRQLRTHSGHDGLAASWCNGTAGLVQLFTLAHRQTGDARYADTAEKAGWTTYEMPAAGGDLCCGLAGRAYALLTLYKHSGEHHWLTRARDLADRAAANIESTVSIRNSLYKGEPGVALLFAELQDPGQASMPLFEAQT